MMNLLLYVESRRTLAQLRAEAGPGHGERRSLLAYPDDIYEDLERDIPAVPPRYVDEAFEWPAMPQAVYAY